MKNLIQFNLMLVMNIQLPIHHNFKMVHYKVNLRIGLLLDAAVSCNQSTNIRTTTTIYPIGIKDVIISAYLFKCSAPSDRHMVYDRTLWRNLIHVADPTQWDKAWQLLLLRTLQHQMQDKEISCICFEIVCGRFQGSLKILSAIKHIL